MNINVEQSFGEFIAKKREEKKITLREMARLLKITPPYLSDIEKDRRNPPEKEKMDKLYYEVEHPLIFVLSSMESIGFNINQSMLDELKIKFDSEIQRTQKEIYELADEEFNVSSPKQHGKT